MLMEKKINDSKKKQKKNEFFIFLKSLIKITKPFFHYFK